MCCVILPVLFLNPPEDGMQYLGKCVVNVSFAAAYFYLNIYWIIPEILEKKKIKLYVLMTALIALNIIVQQCITEFVFTPRVFAGTYSYALVIGRAIISFVLVYVMSNRLAYMELIRKKERMPQQEQNRLFPEHVQEKQAYREKEPVNNL
jgi:hypothetical protein